MLFKIDENLLSEVASIFRAAGHDAMSIHDQQMVGSLDPNIAVVCRNEGRALVTLDLDFSDIRTYPPGDACGIIVLRPRTQSKSNALCLVNQIIPLLAKEKLAGHLWSVQENGLRIRGS